MPTTVLAPGWYQEGSVFYKVDADKSHTIDLLRWQSFTGSWEDVLSSRFWLNFEKSPLEQGLPKTVLRLIQEPVEFQCS
jgi:hypothetical protein